MAQPQTLVAQCSDQQRQQQRKAMHQRHDTIKCGQKRPTTPNKQGNANGGGEEPRVANWCMSKEHTAMTRKNPWMRAFNLRQRARERRKQQTESRATTNKREANQLGPTPACATHAHLVVRLFSAAALQRCPRSGHGRAF